MDNWKLHSAHDGFYIERGNGIDKIWGRIKKKEYYLEIDTTSDKASYQDEYLEIEIEYSTHELIKWKIIQVPIPPEYRFDMSIYHTLCILLIGILDTRRVNYLNMVYL